MRGRSVVATALVPLLLVVVASATAAAAQQIVYTELTGLRGNVTLFAGDYGNNTDRYWSVGLANGTGVPAGARVQFAFDFIGIESGPQCAYDFVGIALARAPSAAAPALSDFTRFCGVAIGGSDTYVDNTGVSRRLRATFSSAWSGAVLWFHTDAVGQGAALGFSLNFTLTAPLALAAPQPVPSQWLFTGQPFQLQLTPGAYFVNPLSDGVLTVSVQRNNSGVLTALPSWAAYNPVTATLSNTTSLPVAGVYTFVVSANNSLGFSASFQFTVSVITVAAYDGTSTLTCPAIAANFNYTCTFTPKAAGNAVFTPTPVVPIVLTGGGSISVTTPAPTPAAPYASVIVFQYSAPASGGVSSVSDSQRLVTPVTFTVTRVPDASSTLACWPLYAPPSSTVNCEFTPRKTGVQIYASQFADMPALTTPTAPGGDSIALDTSQTVTGSAAKYVFTAKLGAFTGPYTIVVTGGMTVTISSAENADGTSTVLCDTFATVVNRPITCTIVPRNITRGATPITSVATSFTVQSDTVRNYTAPVRYRVHNGPDPRDVTASLAFNCTLYANYTPDGRPLLNVTASPDCNATNSILAPLRPAIQFPNCTLMPNVTLVFRNYYNICLPLFDNFTGEFTDYPIDPDSAVSPLSPYVGTAFNFTVTVSRAGWRYLTVRMGNDIKLALYTFVVLDGADNTSAISCTPSVAVGGSALCSITARIRGNDTAVLPASFRPRITGGLNGALTPLLPSARFGAATSTLYGAAAAHYDFSFSATDSAVYTVSDGVTNGHTATITTVANPDANSTFVCSAASAVAGSVLTCTVKTAFAGAPVWTYTSTVRPFVDSVTASGQPAGSVTPRGTFGAVYSTVATDAITQSPAGAASAVVSPLLYADQTVGSAFSFNYTAPTVSGTVVLRVAFVSVADAGTVAATTAGSVSIVITAVPDATSRIICPATRATVGHAMTCFTFPRRNGAAINTDLSAYTFGVTTGTGISATATSTTTSGGTAITSIRMDSAPAYDVSISDLFEAGLSTADTPVTAAAASLGGGINGAPVPVTAPWPGPYLTSATAAAGTGTIGPSGVSRVVYFDITCAVPFETVMVTDGISPPVLVGCQPAANTFSWQPVSSAGWNTLGRAIDVPPTAYTPQPVNTGARRLSQAREFVQWQAGAVSGLAAASARAIPWVSVAVLQYAPGAADPNPIFALSSTGVVARLSGSTAVSMLFTPPTAYGIDVMSATPNAQFVLAASSRTGKVYSFGPAAAVNLLGRIAPFGTDTFVPAEVLTNVTRVTHLVAHSYGIVVANRATMYAWGAPLANTVLPSESTPNALGAVPPARGINDVDTNAWASLGGIVDIQGNEYCVLVLTGAGYVYALSLTRQDGSTAFAGAQQVSGSGSGVAAQQFEQITSLPLDASGAPMRVRQIALDSSQLMFVDSTNAVWTVAPAADNAALNVFWRFANGGAQLLPGSVTATVSPYAWLQNLFAAATAMPTPQPVQPIASPLAISAVTGFVVSLGAPRVHVCPNCTGYADTAAACLAAPYQCASLSVALRAFRFNGTTFYLRRGVTLLDHGFDSAANDLQFIAESAADAQFATAISAGNSYNNYNNKFLYPVRGANPTAAQADGGGLGWPLRGDADLYANTATIDCQDMPCFRMTGKRYTFQGLTVRNATATGSGGCVALNDYLRVSVWDTHFRDCEAVGGDGGAIALGLSTQLYAWGSSFVDNDVIGVTGGSAVGPGGAAIAQRLAVSSATTRTESITAVNCYFGLNTVTAATGSSSGNSNGGSATDSGAGDGGAILALQGNVLLARSTFVANTAPGRGGAVHADGAAAAYISLCVFTDNASGGVGGGVSVLNGAAVWTLTGSEFTSNQATLLGGGVYNEGSPLAVTSTLFNRNRATAGASASGGGLYSIGQQPLGITACEFVRNTARTMGGGLVGSNSVPTITDSLFRENTAGSGGGAALVAQATVVLRNASFVLNNATGSGGGLYSQDITSGDMGAGCNLQWNNAKLGGGAAMEGVGTWTVAGNVSFVANAAANSGGAVYWDKAVPALDAAITYAGNTAPHGPSYASQAKTLRFAPTMPLSFNATSGKAFFFPFDVALYDYYNATLPVDSTSTISVAGLPPTPEVSAFAGGFAVVNGRVTVNTPTTPLGLVLRPDSQAIFAVTATLSDGTVVFSVPLHANVLPCQPGEQSLDTIRCLDCAKGRYSNAPSLSGEVCMDCGVGLTTPGAGYSTCSGCGLGTANPTGNMTSCSTCGAGQYQDALGQTSCTTCWSDSKPRADRSTCDCDALYYQVTYGACDACPVGADCGEPGLTAATVQALAGYQPDVLHSNLRFIACPNPSACQYGGNCSAEFTGNLCAACADGYAKTGAFNCETCPKKLYSQLITAAAVIAVCLAFGILTYLTRRAKKGTRPAVFARVVLNAMQLNALTIYFRYFWPNGIDVLMEYQQKAVYVGANVLSVDCFLGSTYSTPSFYLKTLFFAFIPPIALLVAAGLYAIIYACVKQHVLEGEERWMWYKRNVICMGVIILFTIHPALTQQTLLLLTCIDLGSSSTGSQDYMVGDLAEKCYEGRQLAWMLALGLPMLLLYVLAIPIGLIWEMRRTVNHPVPDVKDDMRRWYRWVLDGYSDKYCYWETICILRKIIVILITVQIGYSYESRSLMTLAVVVISLAAHAYYQPFDKGYLNLLEFCSLANSFVTFFAGHFYFLPNLNDAQKDLLTSILCISNILFAILVVVLYERSAKEGHAEWEKSDLALKKALKQKDRLLAAQTVLSGGATEMHMKSLTSKGNTPRAADGKDKEKEKEQEQEKEKENGKEKGNEKDEKNGDKSKAADAKSAGTAAAEADAKAAGAGAGAAAAKPKSKRQSVLDFLGFGEKQKPKAEGDAAGAAAAAAAAKEDEVPEHERVGPAPPASVELTEKYKLDQKIAAEEAWEAAEKAARKKAEADRRMTDPDDDDGHEPPSTNTAPGRTADGQAVPPDSIRDTPQGPNVSLGAGQQPASGCIVA